MKKQIIKKLINNVFFELLIVALMYYGLLLTLTNISYLYLENKYLNVGRKDLLVRVPFLSTSFTYTIYIFIGILSFSVFCWSKKHINHFLGYSLVALFYYLGILGNLVYGTFLSLFFGTGLTLFSALYLLYFPRCRANLSRG